MPGRHSRAILLTAFALSVCMHVALLAFVPLPSHASGGELHKEEFSVYLEPPPPPPESPREMIEEAPAPPPPEVMLGLNAPLPPSLNWLGFKDFVPQQAPLASTEQAAFTTERIAAAPRESTAQAEPLPAPPVEQPPDQPTLENRPETPPAKTPDVERARTEESTIEPPSDAEPEDSPAAKSPTDQAQPPKSIPFASMLVDLIDQIVQQQAEHAIAHETAVNQAERPPQDVEKDAKDQESKPSSSSPQPSPASPAASRPSPPAAAPPNNKPVAPQPTPGESNQGIQSDKDSQPTSVIEVPRENWQLGKPLAGKGLELKPRRPTFALLTLLTAAPGNPLCIMSFDREGVVKRAKILKSSGDSRIDEGILNSLYYWRAAGEDLQKLQPGELLDIQMRIMLTRRSSE